MSHIQIDDLTPRKTYTVGSTPTTGPFTVPFPFFSDSDLKVYVDGDLQTLTDDYTVSGAGVSAGGSITFVDDISSVELVIVRRIPIKRTTDYPSSGPLNIDALNTDQDKFIAIAQQIEDDIGRSIRLPDSEGDTTTTLASVADRKNKLFGFGTDGELIYPLGPSYVGDTSLGVANVDTLATLQVTSFSIATNAIVVRGRSSIGLGGATYKRGTSGGPGAVQDADEVYWEIADRILNPFMFGAVGDGATDDTAAIQACLDAGLNVDFLPSATGIHKITDALVLRDYHNIRIFGQKIEQFTDGKSIFRAVQKTKGTITNYNGILYGKGDWDGPYIDSGSHQHGAGPSFAPYNDVTWSSNAGREERGVNLLGCTKWRLVGVHTQNCGNAGIAFVGGTDNTTIDHRIEGTQNFSRDLTEKDGDPITQANLQNGIYISNDATYGSSARTTIIGGDISGVAQGIMKECQEGVADVGDGNVIEGTRIHDVTGQHGGYWQGGSVSGDVILRDIPLDGFKVQSGNASANISGVKMRVNAKNVSGNAAVCAVIDVSTGSVHDCEFNVTAENCGTAFNLQPVNPTTGTIKRIKAHVQAKSCTSMCDFGGRNISSVDIYPTGADFEEAGIYITATNSSFRIHSPVVERPNNLGGSFAGIHVASPSATVDLYHPYVSDDDHNMIAGIFNATTGSDIRIHGSVTSLNANGPAIRADALMSEFPADANLTSFSGVNVLSGINNIHSSSWMKVTQESTGASNQELWSRTMDDESVLSVTAVVVAKLAGTSQRETFTKTVLAYRDGGGNCTIQGSAQDAYTPPASGAFAGTPTFQGSGNDLQLVVNSGGASTTYEWTARVLALTA